MKDEYEKKFCRFAHASLSLIISENVKCEHLVIFWNNKLQVWKLRYFGPSAHGLVHFYEFTMLRIQRKMWLYSHLSTKTCALITNDKCSAVCIEIPLKLWQSELWFEKYIFFLLLVVNLRNIETQTILSLITKVPGHICTVQWQPKVYASPVNLT